MMPKMQKYQKTHLSPEVFTGSGTALHRGYHGCTAPEPLRIPNAATKVQAIQLPQAPLGSCAEPAQLSVLQSSTPWRAISLCEITNREQTVQFGTECENTTLLESTTKGIKLFQ